MFLSSSKNRAARRPRLFLYDETFPEKLYAVVQDGFLLSWDETGETINVGDPPSGHSSERRKSDGPQRFEDLVMDLYPGFVQIPLFANLRRLFREYSFNWQMSTSGHFTFSHPCFARGRAELLDNIKTRRKSRPLYCSQRNTRRRSLRLPRDGKKDIDVGRVCSSYDPKVDKSFKGNDISDNKDQNQLPSSCQISKDQLKDIYKSFIKNELKQHVTFESNNNGGSSSSSSQTSEIMLEEREDETDFLMSPQNQNLEDYFIIENENDSGCWVEWTQGPHGYLRPVLNSEGVITKIYHPL